MSISNVALTPTYLNSAVNAEEGDLNDVTEAAGDASNGNSVVNDGAETFIVVRNADSGASHDVVVDVQHPGPDGTLIDAVVGTETYTIPASKTAVIGPFDPTRYGVNKGTVATQGGASTREVTLVTFKVSDANLKLTAVSTRAPGELPTYPNDPFLTRS